MKAKKCGTCRFGGDHFRLFDGTNLHCEHPDEKVSGEPGWDSLRHWYDHCSEWSAKDTAVAPSKMGTEPEGDYDTNSRI